MLEFMMAVSNYEFIKLKIRADFRNYKSVLLWKKLRRKYKQTVCKD